MKINVAIMYARIGYRLAEDEIYILAKLETHAYVGIIMEWVKEGMKENYITYFEKLKRIKSGMAFPMESLPPTSH